MKTNYDYSITLITGRAAFYEVPNLSAKLIKRCIVVWPAIQTAIEPFSIYFMFYDNNHGNVRLNISENRQTVFEWHGASEKNDFGDRGEIWKSKVV